MAKRELQGQAPSRDERFAQRVAHLLQPEDMKTEHYQYGIEAVDGHQAWALFCASGAGDLARVSALLDRDPKLVNAQYWYQFPIHMAVREGHAEVVQLLLQAGADPGQSRYTYNSWDKLLAIAEERGYGEVQALLVAAMRERFGYDPGFVALAEAIKGRDRARVEAVLSEHPDFIRAADALGQWTAALGGADAAKRLGGFLCRTGCRPRSPPRRWPDSAVGLAQRRLLVSDARSAGGSAARPVGYHPPLARLRRGVRPEHRLVRPAMKTASMRCWRPIRPMPAPSMPDGAARCPMPLATVIPESSKNCWTWVLIPTGPKKTRRAAGALFGACAGNHLETAKLLLERGADPNAEVDSSGSCLTIVEFKHGKKGQQMQALLREHGAVTPPFAMDDAALERAMREGDASVAHPQFLHELMGRDNPALISVFLATTPNVDDLFQLTDIWGGNYPSDPDTIRTLADRGLDLHRANWIGRTFLHGCAEKGDVAAARVFLELGADIEAIELEYGGTPLAAAARKGQAEMVRFLLQQGADPAAPAASPWAQPLYWAEKEGHGEVAALLKGGEGASDG